MAEEELDDLNAEIPKMEIRSISDDILKLLQDNTKNPGEALMILQQLSIYLWDQYNIDWSNSQGQTVAETRKQRYLDWVSEMLEKLKDNNLLSQKVD